MITVFSTIRDNLASEKKKSMSGQMTLFDLVPEEEKQDYEIRLPQLEEYSKEIKLGFEKEVLGIYLTGHPLEEYEERWRKNISAVTTDFVLDEETNEVKVKDNQKVTVGGMITEKTVKYTKNNKVMAFLTLEDLVGTVEVIVDVYKRQVSGCSGDGIRGRHIKFCWIFHDCIVINRVFAVRIGQCSVNVLQTEQTPGSNQTVYT